MSEILYEGLSTISKGVLHTSDTGGQDGGESTTGRVTTGALRGPNRQEAPITAPVPANQYRCRKCGGTLTLTGTKMNPQTGHHHYDHRSSGENAHAREGEDELVTCDRCGWTWWVHHG